jgi:predicted membrane-bound spermidine synthase
VKTASGPGGVLPEAQLYAIFFVSGFAAILYQLIWQRALFTLYGTSSESVTVVVTVFMLGLGLGSLAGGALSRTSRVPLPVLFALAEGVIGVFGLASLPLFRWVASLTPAAAGMEVGLPAFALLLLPTLCMGATLPLLAAYAIARLHSVGRALGMLYFVNTLGSAAGCVAAAAYVFGALGQSGSVQLAAAANFAAAAWVLAAWRRPRPTGNGTTRA